MRFFFASSFKASSRARRPPVPIAPIATVYYYILQQPNALCSREFLLTGVGSSVRCAWSATAATARAEPESGSCRSATSSALRFRCAGFDLITAFMVITPCGYDAAAREAAMLLLAPAAWFSFQLRRPSASSHRRDSGARFSMPCTRCLTAPFAAQRQPPFQVLLHALNTLHRSLRRLMRRCIRICILDGAACLLVLQRQPARRTLPFPRPA